MILTKDDIRQLKYDQMISLGELKIYKKELFDTEMSLADFKLKVSRVDIDIEMRKTLISKLDAELVYDKDASWKNDPTPTSWGA